MTREEHLRFCKVCENKSFNSQKGIVCKLTGEIADFEENCENFIGDRDEIVSAEEIELKENKKSKFSDFFSLFVPTEGFFITPIIVDICLFIFLLMAITGVHIFEPDSESLIAWGANFKSLTLDGQYWRLLSNVFIHIGIIHVIVNMYALIYIGLLLEPFIGRKNFIISYLVTGLAASVTSLWWHDIVISAGASGAIFGLYGVYIALITTNLLEKEIKKKILSSMLFFVGYNLLYGLKGGIDNAAHIGGLISGLILGYSLFPSIAKPEMKNKNSFINYSVIVSILIIAFYVVVTTPNTIGEYDKIMNSFVKYEEKAMSFYHLPQFSSNEKYLKAIKEEGIPNWKKCKEAVLEIEAIENLPEELHYNAQLLKKYCDFRIKSFELMAQSLEKNTRMYDYLINSYNQKIDLIIRKLQGEFVSDSLLNEPEYPEFSKFNEYTELLHTDKLFVLNGIPVDNIDDISPEDIKSITVLKAEASHSLYGERGKNGAIIIQTI